LPGISDSTPELGSITAPAYSAAAKILIGNFFFNSELLELVLLVRGFTLPITAVYKRYR
jgi:hypothetical protein